MISDTLLARLLEFRRERDWEQFHSPKNLAIAVSVEAAELLEHFQWTVESQELASGGFQASVAEEIADVAILITYLAHDLGISVEEAVDRKLTANAVRYPVVKSRGRAVKYDQL